MDDSSQILEKFGELRHGIIENSEFNSEFSMMLTSFHQAYIPMDHIIRAKDEEGIRALPGAPPIMKPQASAQPKPGIQN